MSDEKPLVEFHQFVGSVVRANPLQYRSARAGAASDESAFREMQHHLLAIYEGAEVRHSFMADNGAIFDCIPEDQQPALRRSGQRMAKTPGNTPPGVTGQSDRRPGPGEFGVHRLDRLGNRMQCPAGTVPIRRITLEELSGFGSLRSFRQKAPRGKTSLPQPRPAPAGIGLPGHRYAYGAGIVDNLGCRSLINIWDPQVVGQDFSLAQVWCAARSPVVQTVECGWQVWPSKYASAQPVIFVYWTADSYQETGSYNSADFVVKSQTISPGAPLSTISTAGGQQWELEVAWFLSGGNWWLYLNQQVVGYYPGTLFGGGPLATGATEIDVGGETYAADGNWPPMGSGQFANSGPSRTAYQRDVRYFPVDGGSQPLNLAQTEPSSGCYTAAAGSQPAPWNSFIYFGGPGGADCEAEAPALIT